MTTRDFGIIVSCAALYFAGAVWLSGCAGLLYPSPKTASLIVADTPDVAYRRSVKAMGTMGGEMLAMDPQTRALSAKVHGAVVLNVNVSAHDTGAKVEVTGSVLPNKIAIGSFNEVDQYLALLR